MVLMIVGEHLEWVFVLQKSLTISPTIEKSYHGLQFGLEILDEHDVIVGLRQLTIGIRYTKKGCGTNPRVKPPVDVEYFYWISMMRTLMM